MGELKIWPRPSTERGMNEILDAAKSGEQQFIADEHGEFQIRFVRKEREPAGKFLSRGGPKSD